MLVGSSSEAEAGRQLKARHFRTAWAAQPDAKTKRNHLRLSVWPLGKNRQVRKELTVSDDRYWQGGLTEGITQARKWGQKEGERNLEGVLPACMLTPGRSVPHQRTALHRSNKKRNLVVENIQHRQHRPSRTKASHILPENQRSHLGTFHSEIIEKICTLGPLVILKYEIWPLHYW